MNSSDYMTGFRDQILEVSKLTWNHVELPQEKMKMYDDKDTAEKEFKVRNEFQVLLPMNVVPSQS